MNLRQRKSWIPLLVFGLAALWILLYRSSPETGSERTGPETGTRFSKGKTSWSHEAQTVPAEGRSSLGKSDISAGRKNRKEGATAGAKEKEAPNLTMKPTPEEVARIQALFPQFLENERKTFEKWRTNPDWTERERSSMNAALEPGSSSGFVERHYRADFLLDLPPDELHEAGWMLGGASDPGSAEGWQDATGDTSLPPEGPDPNLDGGPLEYAPEYHLGLFAKDESWKQDPTLGQEIADLRLQTIREVVELGGRQTPIENAIVKAADELDLQRLRFQTAGMHVGYFGLVSPEWAQLEEAKKRVFDQYLTGIRYALQVRGLLKDAGEGSSDSGEEGFFK